METDCDVGQLERYSEYVVINNERIEDLTKIVEDLEKKVTEEKRIVSIQVFIRRIVMAIWVICLLYVLVEVLPSLAREMNLLPL